MMGTLAVKGLKNVIKSFEMTLIQNIEQEKQKLKTKETETWKSKTQKDENLSFTKRIGKKCRLL